MSTRISPNAVATKVYVLFDRDRGMYLHENADMFVYATLDPNDGRPDVTEYPDAAAVGHAAQRAGGNLTVTGLTKWVEPEACPQCRETEKHQTECGLRYTWEL